MKRTLTSIAAASLVLGTMAPVAFAGTTSYSFVQRHVSVDGHNLSNPWGFVSGGTNYFPIYYLQSAIGSLIPGATATWDGKNLMINVPGFDASKLMGPTVPGANGIYINGTLVQHFTRIVTNDKGTKTATSFAPIYSLFGVLEQLGLKSTMGADGTWSIVPALAKLTIAGNNTIGLGGSDTLTLTGKDSAGNAVTIDQSKVVWSATGGVLSSAGVFAATAAGTYTVTATYMGTTTTGTVAVYGQASGITVKPASSSLVADNSATDTINVAVVDANGNTVTNFNGSVTLGTNFGTLSSTSVTITNGVGSVTLSSAAGSAGQTATLTPSALASTNGQTIAAGVMYTTGSVSLASAAATSIGLTPALSTVSANGNNVDAVAVAINDQAGNAMTAGSPAYVTFTITGPGSFQNGGTPVTTMSEYVPATGTTLNVYSVQGQQGTISVSAAASGLTAGTTSIKSAVTTAPSSFTVAQSNGTDASGKAFTLYTVQLVDANGNSVVPLAADGLTITDNTGTVGGAVKYFAVSGGQPTGTGGTAASIAPALSTSTGQFQFAVENTTVSTSTATLTIVDALTSTSKTASYSFQTGAAASALIAGQTAATSYVQAGQTNAYTVSLADANGNALTTAGTQVDVYFTSNSAAATINGVTGWSVTNPLVVTTGSAGTASVSVVVPAGATGGYTLAAKVVGGTPVSTDTVTVNTATQYATSLGLNSTASGSGTAVTFPTSLSAGATVQGTTGAFYVVPFNAVSAYTGGNDSITYTTSNSNVLAITGATNGSFTQGAGTAAPTITGLQAGTATITITDASNPSQPKLSYTVAVAAGSATKVLGVNPDGTNDTAYTYAASGVVGPFTVQLVDNGNNVAPATSPVTLTAAQVEAALGVSGVTGIRLSSTGSDVTSVTIAQNQSTVQVWVDGVTAGNVTTATVATALSAEYPTAVSAKASGNTVVLTFNNPVTGAVSAAAFTATVGGTSTAATTATVAGNTVTLTFSGPASVTLAWTAANSLATGFGAGVQAGSIAIS